MEPLGVGRTPLAEDIHQGAHPLLLPLPKYGLRLLTAAILMPSKSTEVSMLGQEHNCRLGEMRMYCIELETHGSQKV